MKKVVFCVFCCIFSFILTGCEFYSDSEIENIKYESRQDGYSYGYNDGYNAGYKDGDKYADNDLYEFGYNEGYDYGYQRGYGDSETLKGISKYYGMEFENYDSLLDYCEELYYNGDLDWLVDLIVEDQYVPYDDCDYDD